METRRPSRTLKVLSFSRVSANVAIPDPLESAGPALSLGWAGKCGPCWRLGKLVPSPVLPGRPGHGTVKPDKNATRRSEHRPLPPVLSPEAAACVTRGSRLCAWTSLWRRSRVHLKDLAHVCICVCINTYIYKFHEKRKCHIYPQSHYLPQKQLLLTIDVAACVRARVCMWHLFLRE